MPFSGDCAVRHMGAVLNEFEEKLFPAMAARITDMPVVPEGARSSTMNINSIHGGQKEQDEDFDGLPSHCVPDSCRITIDRRFLVEEPLDQVRDEVTVCCRVYVQTVARAIEDVMGQRPQYVASPGTYDQKHIDRIGKLKNCIAYGPGILELAHKPDEWIGMDDMIDSACGMGAALETLLLPRD
jgi:succinyl-diaminopimelate desuccinylase